MVPARLKSGDGIIMMIIKGHSLRRACLLPATNTQDSKPRPPTTNARGAEYLEFLCLSPPSYHSRLLIIIIIII